MNPIQSHTIERKSDGTRLAGRRGLSVLEFIGCLLALIGGVWLGAIYLGIDLHKVTYVALSESKFMDQVPESWRPEIPESEKGPSQAELAESVRNELATLRKEIASLRESQQTKATPAPEREQGKSEAHSADAAEQTVDQPTLEYWNKLREIVQNHATLQIEAEKSATTDNAAKVATLKGRIGRLSATAIEALPTGDVDPALETFGSELAEWYESGADLNEEAVQIWGGASQGAGNPQLVKEWQQANAQFENEGRLLQGRATALRAALSQQYGVEFPPITGF